MSFWESFKELTLNKPFKLNKKARRAEKAFLALMTICYNNF
ncbi:hypothetical protein GA0061071_1282 [Kosakonia oryzendophytica]|uniref:Uncharacterized protein n=2 Tax=Kosakonia TaxID=1330547 RepID=A0A1C4EFS3_9ENTR|nr:hypothetical protein GA0061071_1282 [Kosakonia oryzendophytica]SCC70088.1 hypothetical protein GA0061070_11122 [Kosakonia oryziphila]